MDNAGVALPLVIAQLVNLALIAVWLILVGVALYQIRHCPLSEGIQLVWILVILCLPFLGAAAFLIVQPGKASMRT